MMMSDGSRNLYRGQRPDKETADRTERPREVPPPDPSPTPLPPHPHPSQYIRKKLVGSDKGTGSLGMNPSASPNGGRRRREDEGKKKSRMPEIGRLPNSAHVRSHSSAALPRERELWCPRGGKPLALELVFREARLAGGLGLSSWADGGCPTGVLGVLHGGAQRQWGRERERAGPGEGGGSGGQAAERGDRASERGAVFPTAGAPGSRQASLGLGQLSGWVEGGAAGPEGAWWGLSSAVLTRGAGGSGASARKGSLRPGSQVLLRPARWEGVSGPMGHRWGFPPLVHGSVRLATSGLRSGLRVLLLKWECWHTASSPLHFHQKASWGLHFPRNPPFLWASAGRRAQAGSQLQWKLGCVGMAGGASFRGTGDLAPKA